MAYLGLLLSLSLIPETNELINSGNEVPIERNKAPTKVSESLNLLATAFIDSMDQ